MSHNSGTGAPSSIQHPQEDRSNAIRVRADLVEPKALRTFTPSQAVIARSAGAYHWTADGRKLADFSSGVLVANLGHNPTAWWRRVLDYLELGELSTDAPYVNANPLTAYNAITDLDVTASERLVRNLRREVGGARLEQVMWAASGSEAIQKALWVALARNPQRDMMLATRHGFHGKKGLAGAVTGTEQDRERDSRVRFLTLPTDECIDIERRNQPIDLAPYEQELARLADEHGSRLCCVITEPYLGGGGSFHPHPEYLQLLQRFCHERDLLFILDEVQSNFGRTGTMYAFTRYGIEPDIVCLGKGLGNGVPVSAAVGPRTLFDGLKYGEASDTWSANPLSSAAVLATLDEFENGDVLANAHALSTVLEAGLSQLKETGLITHVRGEGTVWGIECSQVGKHAPADIAAACVEACYLGNKDGQAIHLLGPLAGKVLRVSPPLIMCPDEARDYLGAMKGIFAALHDQLTDR